MLSCYLLTLNGEKYLAEILEKLSAVVDELVIVDSGSTDDTKAIAKQFNTRFLHRDFDNFSNQRQYALDQCSHAWVLSLDDDEIPQADFIAMLSELKKNNFMFNEKSYDAYRIQRRWFAMGREIHNFYPSGCPDYPIRLFEKSIVSYGSHSRLVHETPEGFSSEATLPGWVVHYTCQDKKELMEKLDQYTKIAAQDLKPINKRTSFIRLFFSPFGAFCKWYFLKGGYKDGKVGLLLSFYAARYTYLKYKHYVFKM